MTDLANPMCPLTQVTHRPVAWLWPGRLPLGKLAMFDGDPGRGKSMVTLDLCARVSTGRPMPDGTGGGPPANAVIIQGEDFADDTVLPRLKALGADLGRIFIFRPDFLERIGHFSLPSHADKLDDALAANDPRLLVIDPIMAFLDVKVNAYNDQSLRRALSPLAGLADRRRCTGLMVRHINKRQGGRPLHRGLGSIAFNAACRSAWLFDADPDDPSRLVMAHVKNNYGPPQPSLAFRFHAQDNEPPTLDWLGPCDWSADQLLIRRGHKPVMPLAKDRALDFLSVFLENGPRSTEEIWPAAQELGLERRTLQYARGQLEIESKRVWTGKKQLTYWLLPKQELPDSVPPEFRPGNVDDLFDHLRQTYPVNPLDDED
jgi:hypothetical protein